MEVDPPFDLVSLARYHSTSSELSVLSVESSAILNPIESLFLPISSVSKVEESSLSTTISY